MDCATTCGSQPAVKDPSPGHGTMAAYPYTTADIDAGFEAAAKLDTQCLAEADLDAMTKLGQLKDLMKSIEGKCDPTEEVKITAACVNTWHEPNLESFASAAGSKVSGQPTGSNQARASVRLSRASSETPQPQTNLKHLSEKVQERIAANREEAKRRRLHTICQTAGLHISA